MKKSFITSESVSLLCAILEIKNSFVLHAHSEDSYQTRRMPRLIGVDVILQGLSCIGSSEDPTLTLCMLDYCACILSSDVFYFDIFFQTSFWTRVSNSSFDPLKATK